MNYGVIVLNNYKRIKRDLFVKGYFENFFSMINRPIKRTENWNVLKNEESLLNRWFFDASAMLDTN